jgi:hypothetical protein
VGSDGAEDAVCAEKLANSRHRMTSAARPHLEAETLADNILKGIPKFIDLEFQSNRIAEARGEPNRLSAKTHNSANTHRKNPIMPVVKLPQTEVIAASLRGGSRNICAKHFECSCWQVATSWIKKNFSAREFGRKFAL